MRADQERYEVVHQACDAKQDRDDHDHAVQGHQRVVLRGLEELLEVRGYTVLDPTLVMWRELRMANGEGTNSFREQSLDDWFAHHARLSGIAPEKLATHRAILERIHLPRLFATIQTPPSPSPYEGEGRGEVSPYHGEEGGTVACGLDVLDRECFGLFELVTDTAQRGKGFGTQLATEMLKWAQARGARRAFLQVTEANVTARRLYEKVGFRELYRYWYRVK